MAPNDFLDYLRDEPFQPFRIHVSDGTVYEIKHPELVKVSLSRADVYFPEKNEPHAIVVGRESVALSHITRLEPMEKKTKAKKVGEH